MSWATRKTPTVERDGSPSLDPSMLEPVKVRALKDFQFGLVKVYTGDLLKMPKHKAEYARFLQLVTLDVDGAG